MLLRTFLGLFHEEVNLEVKFNLFLIWNLLPEDPHSAFGDFKENVFYKMNDGITK